MAEPRQRGLALSAHDQFGAFFVAYIKLTYSLVTILVNDVTPSVTSSVV